MHENSVIIPRRQLYAGEQSPSIITKTYKQIYIVGHPL